ncbi:hypothetical protein [Streptomyces sp. NPDC088736]|uniref:hypothetical protein n=1 Tax=Streptomyces sp. NPDC088736 TaxID=3365881 RepID=UPI00380475BB
MSRLQEWAYDTAWPQALPDRLGQVMWVLAHEADLDADFLAIYHINLREQEVDGPRYFALAHRLSAFQGVMAARVEEERDEQPSSSTPTRTQDTAPPPRQGSPEAVEVSLTQFRAMYPGWVSVAQGG